MNSSRDWTVQDEAQSHASQILQDDLIQLRESEPGDFQTLSRWWNDPQWAVLQQRTIKPRPEERLHEMFSGWSKNNPQSSDAGFSIFETSSGALAGHITLYGGTLPHRAAEMAVMMGPEFVSRSLGTRAAQLMVGYGFREMGLHRIAVKVLAFNTRALRAYAKAGFVVEGKSRDAVFHNGTFHDEVSMSILAHEYFAAH